MMKASTTHYGLLRTLVGNLPFSILKKAGLGKLLVVYYHLVSDDDVPHVTSLYQYKGIEQFRNDLGFLLRHYSPVALSEVIQWSKGLGTLPRDAFLLTFDDGLREIHDVIAPILLEYGIPATFFVSSAFVDNRELCYQHKASLLQDLIRRKGASVTASEEIARILSRAGLQADNISDGIRRIDYRRKEALDQIGDVLLVDFGEYLSQKLPYLTSAQVRKLLDQDFTIGAHSIDHPYYSSLSLTEQLEQTIVSVKWVREMFALGYGAFAFPHNDDGVSAEFFKVAHESGLVEITFGTNGMLDGDLRTHRQRVSLENPLLPARELLAWQYARRLYKCS